MRKNNLWALIAFLLLLGISSAAYSQENLKGFDASVYKWTSACRDEVANRLEKMIINKQLTENQLFDTFYIPIPDTNPQKYHTKNDSLIDQEIQSILDRYLAKNRKLVYVKLVDRNGYAPTHNKKYSEKLAVGDKGLQKYRTKRIFYDITGRKAVQNKDDYLLQRYNRDTGEKLIDLSMPVYVRGKHWGAIRFGYKAAK
jgi:hypothetical protein